ncbi:MAG: flagellar basal-body rod protein FlgG [Pseudomonadota bacterium]
MQALRTAATGMLAQELNVEVISNNIANLRTTGFKKQRAEFQDLIYQDIRQVGSTTSEQGTMVPSGIQIGTGVRTAATPRVHTQGTIAETGKDYDVAVRGEGLFQVQLPDGRTAYTRDGTFSLDGNGLLVTKDGYQVGGGITVPTTALSVTINSVGLVQVLDNTNTPSDVGQIQLARFINRSGLQPIGDNLFLETAASGTAQVSNPGTDGAGTVLQKYAEDSNVNAVSEISDLIAAQRAYEMNARVIRAADDMLSNTTLTR